MIRRLPRHLHPGAWWLWALGLATAASRTTNPLLLLLIVGVAGYVVAARRAAVPWARSYALFLRVGAVVLVLRLVIQIAFGARVPGHLLFTLPEAPLPDWAAGVSVGGPVTVEALAVATYEALRLVALLACFGAANSLASPYRLLRLMPRAVYEIGVAVSVALSFAPLVVISLQRVREGRRLRGRPTGLRGLRGLAVPVLEGALERAVALAAAMDARGYGRRTDRGVAVNRLRAAATTIGMVAVTGGVYGLLDDGSPGVLGAPTLAAGALLLVASLALGGRRSVRTRYRPDPWRTPEWLVTASGVLAASVLVAVDALGGSALHPTVSPLVAPTLPLLPTIGVLLGLLAAVAAPHPPRATAAAVPAERALAAAA